LQLFIYNHHTFLKTIYRKKMAFSKHYQDKIKQIGHLWVREQTLKKMKTTEPGSLKFLLFGEQSSVQSLVIKFGHVGETLAKEMINCNSGLTLLQTGPQIVNEKGKKKDIDLIWKDDERKTIYVRELKGNIELDSEKLPATFEKIPGIFIPWLESQHPNYKIDVGILNWGVYAREDLTKGLSHISRCEASGVKVDHFKDFFDLIGFEWEKDDFYSYFRTLGDELNVLINADEKKKANEQEEMKHYNEQLIKALEAAGVDVPPPLVDRGPAEEGGGGGAAVEEGGGGGAALPPVNE
jgi:hypothetical protein